MDANPDYKIDQLKSDVIISVSNINGFNAIETACAEYTAYLDFGNGDIDTLNSTWTPAIYGSQSACDPLERAVFTFNDEVAEIWDFGSDNKLLGDLGEGNDIFLDSRTTDPIVIKLVKKTP